MLCLQMQLEVRGTSKHRWAELTFRGQSESLHGRLSQLLNITGLYELGPFFLDGYELQVTCGIKGFALSHRDMLTYSRRVCEA